MSSIHFFLAPDRRFWSWLGVLFGAFYGGILGAVYWVIVAVVPARIASGDLTGLAPLIVVSPHSTLNSLEGLGYGLMGLAALFGGLAFPWASGTAWIRALFVVNGIGGILGFAFVLVGWMVPGMVALIVWSVALPLGCGALVRYLWKLGAGAPRALREATARGHASRAP